MSNIRQLTYKDTQGNLINADSVVLSSKDGAYGIRNATTGEVVVTANTAVSNVSTGIYQYDTSSLATGITYELVWKVVYSGKTSYYPQTFTVETLVLTGDVGYTVEEIAKQAGNMIDEVLDLTDDDTKALTLEALNYFCDDVAKRLPPMTSYTLTATANQWYTLPADLIEIESVESNGNEAYYEIRDVYPAKILFTSSGTFDVWYKKVPYKLSTTSNKPDMHPYLHGTGAFLLAARYLARDESEDVTARVQQLVGQYESDRDERIQRLSNPSGRYKVIKDVLGGYRG